MLQVVDVGALPQFTIREDRIAGTTQKWRNWAETREIDEWLQTIAGVLDQGWNDQYAIFSFFSFQVHINNP